MKKLNREQLYKWMWSCPATRIADELRISGSALGKKCRANNIPTPGRGYWRQVEQGKPVQRVPLPNPEQGFIEVSVRVSEERAAELDLMPVPVFGSPAKLTELDNLSGGLAVTKVLGVVETSQVPSTNDFESAILSPQTDLAEQEDRTLAPTNVVTLATLYGQFQLHRQFFEALRAAGRECDAPTKAVLMLWSAAARGFLSYPDPIAQVIDECRSIALGESSPEWWISLQKEDGGLQS